MVIIYTIDDAGFEQQGLAYSQDGETFHQYENNPIIGNPNIRDFRFVFKTQLIDYALWSKIKH